MRALLVRPWIHDFSAYDLWIQPLGLLSLAAVLKCNDFELDYLDCLQNRYDIREDGRARFRKAVIQKPSILHDVQRHYGRFGVTIEQFHAQAEKLSRPDVILVTSGMTYWYPGLQETIQELRMVFPDTKIVLGGIYATLMTEHARNYSGADVVVSGEFEQEIVPFLTGRPSRRVFKNLDDFPWPAWELTKERNYRVLMTSRGCPYRCTFCASDILNQQKFLQRSTENVLGEVEKYYFEDGVRHIVFYDDALLIHHRKHLEPFLSEVLTRKWKLNFHAPNGLNAREIDVKLAELMHESGFRTIRLSLESVNPDIQKIQGNNKINNALFEKAILNLYGAGYVEGDIECYLIQGLPGQTADDVHDSLQFVANLGVIARLATFSPIPGTAEAELTRQQIGDDFLKEPLLQNHSIFPLKNTQMNSELLQALKD